VRPLAALDEAERAAAAGQRAQGRDEPRRAAPGGPALRRLLHGRAAQGALGAAGAGQPRVPQVRRRGGLHRAGRPRRHRGLLPERAAAGEARDRARLRRELVVARRLPDPRAHREGAADVTAELDTRHVAATADVAGSARIGEGTRIWHLAQVQEGAVLGRSCVVGRGACIGPGVTIGDNVKIQNYALVYAPATLEDGVFVGPAAVLTNDTHPRSVDGEGRLKTGADWTPVGVTVREGASLGARSVCVAPVVVGR